MLSLQELGRVYATDKGDAAHSFHGTSYLDVYASYFDPVRERVRTVLELGVWRGESLMMWRDYFPRAEVWGIDIDPAAAARDLGPRCHVITGGQTDSGAIWRAAPGERLDIVIDDGSHLVPHLLSSLSQIWGRVTRGGFYCMEDLGCTHRDVSEEVAAWPGMSLNRAGDIEGCRRAEFEREMMGIAREMDGLEGDRRFLHFWPMMAVMRKT